VQRGRWCGDDGEPHGREQRVADLGGDESDHIAQRQFLVVERGEERLAELCHQVGESLGLADSGTQQDGVAQQPDHVRPFAPRTVRAGRGEHYVCGLIAQPGQPGREGRGQY
jgi:hypothetical protein